MQGPRVRIGLVAEIAGYAIVIVDDTVTVSCRADQHVMTTQHVAGLGRFVDRAKELRVVLAAFPDFEVAYIVDLAQDGYGYAVNLQVPWFSEWGYAPHGTW